MKALLKSAGKRIKTAKALSLAVGIAGVAVMLGWIFNIPVLKSIIPNWTSMKFDTAICFVLSGITLFFIACAVEGEIDVAQILISISTLIMLMFMGTLFFSFIFGVHTGAEELFIKETTASAKTVMPGQPSIATMINFILIALAGVLTMLDVKSARGKLKIIGVLVGIIGTLAVIGYIINAPPLYYYIKGVNTAMAAHTAILFMALGLGLLCL